LFEIQYILSKTDKAGLYDTVLYNEKDDFSDLTDKIKEKISSEVLKTCEV